MIESETKHVNPKDLILSPKEYAVHPWVKSGERFYQYDIVKEDKTIRYLGVEHANDPESDVYEVIKRSFDEYGPDIIYIEGMVEINARKPEVGKYLSSLDDSEIKRKGENMYALKLALDANIDFESPEPDMSTEIAELVNLGFSRQDIFNYYSYLMIDQYLRGDGEKTKEDCLFFLNPYIKRFAEKSQFEASEIVEFKSKLVEDMDVSNSTFYKESVDPIPWEGKVFAVSNEISVHLDIIRDSYALERINEGLKTHKRIMIVYGSAHAVMLEPALRDLAI